jgi:hypothetical protein
MQVHIIAGATGDRVGSGGDVVATELYPLTGEEAQSLGAGCFQVEQGDVVVDEIDVPDPGGDVLLWNLPAALGFRSFEDNIAKRGIAAHQDMAAVSLCVADEVIVVPDLADLTGNNPCQALAAITIAATITKRKTGVQTSFE